MLVNSHCSQCSSKSVSFAARLFEPSSHYVQLRNGKELSGPGFLVHTEVLHGHVSSPVPKPAGQPNALELQVGNKDFSPGALLECFKKQMCRLLQNVRTSLSRIKWRPLLSTDKSPTLEMGRTVGSLFLFVLIQSADLTSTEAFNMPEGFGPSTMSTMSTQRLVPMSICSQSFECSASQSWRTPLDG